MKRKRTPPLGARPRFICEEHRINELKESMLRFLEFNNPIPLEFVEEYNELVLKLPEED